MTEYRSPTKEPLRFGVFEIDPSARELRKHGVRIKLQDQPFAVLLILLEKPGQLVTKEELQQRLWPADTFVEFDKGIYNAMKRLRETLGDEAETPRYIETLPRRGYRFIAPVQKRDGVGGRLELPPTPERTLRLPGSKRFVLLASCLCALALAVIFIRLKPWSFPAVPKVVDTAQVTKDGLKKDWEEWRRVTFKLVSDGNGLYFQERALDQTETNAALGQVSIHGGETARIPISLRNPLAFDFSQTRSELLVGSGESESSSRSRPLWVLPLPLGPPPHRLGDIFAEDACWAPNGRYLAFTNGKDVFVAEADGSKVRKLASADGYDYLNWIRFSPDGTRLRFTVGRLGFGEESEVMEVAADGSGLHRLPIDGGCCGSWSADGRYYFYRKGRNIWVLPEQKSVFGRVEFGNAVQLTIGPVGFNSPTPSTDGRNLFVVGSEPQPRVELVYYDSRSRRFVPFLGGISAEELEVSPDGQWVTYTTFPESDLWRSKLDGSERLQLTFAPTNAHEPRWSPDGKQILFEDFPHRILVVSANGGAPHQLMPADHPELIGAGAWMPDGSSIIFGRHMGCPLPDDSCMAIYRLGLKTQQVSKLPGSDGLLAARLSRDGHYLTAISERSQGQEKVMLYNFQTQRWSELAKGSGGIAWSHDNRFVYLLFRNKANQSELTRISVPDGKVQGVLDLKGVTLGGLWSDWISLLSDDSPLLQLDRTRNIEEIYRLELQYR
jgi:DNA-binding winged helix-turn-helix (wHTH) protein/Tol biopolymer transport system component